MSQLRLACVALLSTMYVFSKPPLLAVGCYHQCKTSVASDGAPAVVCWGDNSYGQCGYDAELYPHVTPDADLAPVVTDSDGFVGLYAGCLHTCAVNARGRVRCWGFQDSVPQSSAGAHWEETSAACGVSSDVRVDAFGTCVASGADENGRQHCWGEKQTNNKMFDASLHSLCTIEHKHSTTHTCTSSTTHTGTSSPSCTGSAALSAPFSGTPSETSVGSNHITANQSPTNTVMSTSTPSQSSTVSPTVSATGSESSLAVSAALSHTSSASFSPSETPSATHTQTQTGTHSPSNTAASTDTSTLSPSATPSTSATASTSITASASASATLSSTVSPSAARVTVKSIAAGEGHTCILYTNGSVKCWGSNSYGQLGYGNVIDANSPLNVGFVPLQSPVGVLVAGDFHTCAIYLNGSAKCWGWNFYGQLGYNYTENVRSPAEVGFIPLQGDILQLEPGGSHTCVLYTNANVQCWGRNNDGRLGYGHTDSVLSSVGAGFLPLNQTVTQLAAGGSHTCSLHRWSLEVFRGHKMVLG